VKMATATLLLACTALAVLAPVKREHQSGSQLRREESVVSAIKDQHRPSALDKVRVRYLTNIENFGAKW